MKKLLSIAVIIPILAGGCTSGQKYDISGTWADGEGNTVYLKKEISKDAYDLIDSAVVADGFFVMKGKVPNIDRYIVAIGNRKEKVLIDEIPLVFAITSEERENRDGRKITVIGVEFTGSPEQDIMREVSNISTGKSMMGLGSMFALAEVKDDSVKLDSVYKAIQLMNEGINQRVRSFFDSINDSYAITYSIGDFIAREYPFEDVVRYYDNLTPRIKKSYPGKLLSEKVNSLRDINIGGTAPEIDLPGPDGINVKLSSLRGSYVLLDFWALWCGPCLAEVPNVKAIYDDYHDKGFEIYGVSLDDEKQRDAWLSKIEDFDMNWVQVSSLKGWECPTAKRYNVTGIPKMFLLDKEGRIIAIDLRGEKLREKVASLFE